MSVANINSRIFGATTGATLCSLLAIAQAPQPTVRPGDKVQQSLNDYRLPLPKEGLVPDKETAIQIAEVILFRLYGKANIIVQRPYVGKKEYYIWWVSGTSKPNELSRTFRIGISRSTGAVLYLTI